ncbi:hypothetical protein PALA111701_27580 [Paenibacillus lactis]|uniref:Uncharacterized protein n=2 Tax=Paenibacillus lactis TaxID=228574 RepID=G4HLU0_9BACL|nr:hypothetical protein PaelaDRAFT_4951 [Paenibacillus lactis 154]MBP1893163.1 hypothetical protein [Paenibacillus lactis]
MARPHALPNNKEAALRSQTLRLASLLCFTMYSITD